MILLAVIFAGCSTPEPMVTEAPTATTESMEEATTEPTATEAMDTETPEPTATEAPEPTPTAEPTATPQPTETPEASEEMGTEWTADGNVGDGEYTGSADLNGIRLWWRNDESHLFFAMEGETAGWVAVGLNPELGMQGADFILGYVEDGEAQIWDAWGTARTGANHPPDTELGGSEDIVAFAGVEEAGVTRFEVQIPLDSGDEYDHVLQPGQSYPVIVAIGGQDEFNAYHTQYASGEISLSAP